MVYFLLFCLNLVHCGNVNWWVGVEQRIEITV